MAINPLPTPPAPTDSPQDFNTKAFSLLGALPDFVTEANAQAVQVDTDAGTATSAASTATTKASEALASADLAEDWATKTDGEVAGGEFSAKKYAQDSFDSADASAASAVEAAGLVENYQGALASDPALNKDGDPLVAGDWYVNTATGLIRAYDGAVWVTSVNVTAGVSGFSAGTTGLTPSTNTQGEIELAGTLSAANGGTGLTSPGTAGNVLASDGTNWTSSSLLPSLPVGALQYFAGATTTTYPGEEWLLCDGSILTQTAYSELFSKVGLIADGPSTWVSRTSGTTTDIRALAYGDGAFVYANESGEVRTSTDAITWTARTSGTASQINSLIYGNGIFVYAGRGGVLATSTDAITWTARTSGTTSEINALVYDNGIFVYAGEGGVLRTSTDAITWTARTSGTTNFIRALAYGDGAFVYAGTGGVLRTSTNGITWIVRSSGTTSNIFALNYGNGAFVYAGAGGVLATSTNGIAWSPRLSQTSYDIQALTYANNTFVYGAGNGVLATSTDAIAWNSRTSGTASIIQALTYGNGTFVYAGAGGVLATSPDFNYNTSTEFVLPFKTINIATGVNNLFVKAE